MRRLFLSAAFFFSFSALTYAQLGENEPDSRVKKQLTELGYSYDVTGSGSFKVTLKLKSERTQIVLISSKTYEYGGMEIREVYSPAASVEDKSAWSHSNLFTFLEENENFKLGAWQILGGEAPFVLQFGVRISANSSAKILEDIISLAAKTADEMETRITTGDKY